MKKVLATYLPLWIVLLSVLAYFQPSSFTLLSGFAPFGLALIFLLMGMQLSIGQLILAIRHPKNVFIGIVLKWGIVVLVSVTLAKVFFVDHPEIATGIILSGTVPSGTSANLYSLLAGGDIALSITMATVDTLISPFLTPILTQTFAGTLIPIDGIVLFKSIVLIVFVPLFSGIFLQWKFGELVDQVKPYTPTISQISLLLIVASVVSNAQPTLEVHIELLPKIAGVVLLQVSIPMFLGYSVAKLLKVSEQGARSILFQVGICNTALAATLAMAHISELAAIPAVLNMVINLSLGAFVSNYLANKPLR